MLGSGQPTAGQEARRIVKAGGSAEVMEEPSHPLPTLRGLTPRWVRAWERRVTPAQMPREAKIWSRD